MNSSIFQQYLSRYRKTTEQTVNITNTNGVIIASTHTGNIGQFRNGAHSMLEQKLPVMVLCSNSPDSDNSLRAVYYAVYEEGNITAVVEVLGNDAAAHETARAVKTACELLSEESQRHTAQSQLNYGNDLAKTLLYAVSPNRQQIRKITGQYNLTDELARLPILIQFGMLTEDDAAQRRLIFEYERLSVYHPQDILMTLDNSRMMLCKYLPDILTSCKDVANEVVSCLDEFFGRWLTVEEVESVTYFYGPIQLHFEDYARIYRCICWLERHLQASPAHVNRFSDYLSEFLLKNLPEDTQRPIFDASIYRIQKMWDTRVFDETMSGLISSNMQLELAAQKLYLHKNTVVFRLNKIKSVLGLDPLNNRRDANYLIMLYYYWRYYCK